jgi:hypothetical protein
MRSLCRSALVSCLVVAAAGLSGVRHSVIAQTGPTPTFPSAVDLITVDAVVLDGKGHPVPGLTRDDFVLTEDGRPQDIATFETVDGAAAPTARPPDRDDSAVIVTNSAPRGPGRGYAVLLDDVWALPVDVPGVREALTKFLQRSVRSGDQVSLASTTGARASRKGSRTCWRSSLASVAVDLPRGEAGRCSLTTRRQSRGRRWSALALSPPCRSTRRNASWRVRRLGTGPSPRRSTLEAAVGRG